MRKVSLALANPKAQNPVARPTAAVCQIHDAPFALRFWHLASLDAPTVAIVWALSFAWVVKIRLPLWTLVLLSLVAWAVYIGDRLLDARRAFRTGLLHRLRQRHHFHWRHRRILFPLAVAAACAAAWIVCFLMPIGFRERDSVLAAAALVYFTRVHSGRIFPPFRSSNPPSFFAPIFSSLLSKELLVGLLFTAGCILAAWSRTGAQPNSPLWPLGAPALFFVALAWLNCHAIERWENSGHPQPIHFSAPPLAVSGLLLAAFLYPAHTRSAALVASGAASVLFLLLLDRLRSRLTPLALRAAADLALLTPALFIPLALVFK
jgi:hypothetical protein